MELVAVREAFLSSQRATRCPKARVTVEVAKSENVVVEMGGGVRFSCGQQVQSASAASARVGCRISLVRRVSRHSGEMSPLGRP